MMWWAADGSWARGWSWPAILIMAGVMVMCMTMMRCMVGHCMGGARPRHDDGSDRGVPERTLATRLANGEIDVDEYERLLGVLQRTRTRPDQEEV